MRRTEKTRKVYYSSTEAFAPWKRKHGTRRVHHETADGREGVAVSAVVHATTVAEPVVQPAERRAALICACIVGFAYSANYTNHAPLAGALARQFGFNQTLAGLLTTGIFITHGAMQVPGGHLADRWTARRLLSYALPWVALGNFAIAFAGAYWQLLAWKVFTGIGTGICFVAGARYVHQAAAGPRLNVAQGLFGGSVLLGSGFVIFA